MLNFLTLLHERFFSCHLPAFILLFRQNAYLSSVNIDNNVPSLWILNVSSPQEREEANVCAVVLAAERAGDKLLYRDEWQERLQERMDEVTRRR